MVFQIDPALINRLENTYSDQKLTPQDIDKMRLYETGNYYVPRVTSLLDTIKEDYLLQWANSLGWKRMSYTKTLQTYADMGTLVHEEIENYLKNGIQGTSPGFLSFREWWDKFITVNTITNIESEVSMSCPYFAGTTDLFCNANGKNCLVDFKTSKHISYKYIMQLAAYCYMMQTELNREISYCIIFQVDKVQPYKYQVYLYDLSSPEFQEMFTYALDYIMYLSCGFLHNQYMRQKFEETENIAKTASSFESGCLL